MIIKKRKNTAIETMINFTLWILSPKKLHDNDKETIFNNLLHTYFSLRKTYMVIMIKKQIICNNKLHNLLSLRKTYIILIIKKNCNNELISLSEKTTW